VYIVILAGGSGTRFWPLSRTTRPKQLISVTGDRSMLQRTVERVLPLKPKRILVITNHLQAEETAHQLQGYRTVPIDVVSESAARNTAPAIGLAAAIISAHDPSGVMAVLPADHYIRDEEAFRDTLLSANHAAQNGYLVTLGIMPTRPETGYGYIEADLELRGVGPFPVRRFVEKPPLSEALRYLDAGNYFWNSGMFVWRTDVINKEMQKHVPALHAGLSRISFNDDVWALSDLESQIKDIYQELESISIDYAVMEKTDNVQVLPVEMGWSDVGSWNALPEVAESDQHGTVCINAAGHVAIDSTDCLIYSDNRMVATIGMHNVVVVSTKDALLVCDRDRCQDVKKIVEQLGTKGLKAFL
jgi:mannose-1-phosphate guanylyltransferase/mannose-6-phosphate isomerase